MQSRVYGGASYPFQQQQQQQNDIEMTDFSQEDERLSQEDLQILEMIK
jgi:hypothetical protein